MDSTLLGRELEGRKLRLFFFDGEIAEGVVIEAPHHDSCEGCDGFSFNLSFTNRPAKYEALRVKIGSALWTKFEQLQKYEIVAW